MESTPSKALAHPNRLLYRGSLSLPDSHLLLDGLSLTVKTADTHGSPALLSNTLALTLESLRGLPLHLIGTVRVKDVWIEPPPSDISVDIHPDSTLTRIYFENLFCLNPITSDDRKSEYGVRVSLTDNDDPETPDLIIYAEFRPIPPSSSSSSRAPPSSPSPATASTSHSPPQTLHLLAARILPGPPPPPSSFRLPRPDDPTPRQPPVAFGAGGAGAKRKRESDKFDLSAAAEGGAGSASKRARDATGKGKGRAIAGVDAKALGKDARVGTAKGDVFNFKVPSVPVRRTVSEADVFGGGVSAARGKEKEKAKAKDGEKNSGEKEGEGEGVGRENKNTVKRAVMKALAREGIGKTHGEFKELFHTTYHGVCLVFRRRMGTGPLDGSLVEHFVDAHVKMYVKNAPE